jgi:hypothetical protein
MHFSMILLYMEQLMILIIETNTNIAYHIHSQICKNYIADIIQDRKNNVNIVK